MWCYLADSLSNLSQAATARAAVCIMRLRYFSGEPIRCICLAQAAYASMSSIRNISTAFIHKFNGHGRPSLVKSSAKSIMLIPLQFIVLTTFNPFLTSINGMDESSQYPYGIPMYSSPSPGLWNM